MNCSQCGTQNKHDGKFCSNCGNELQRAEPSPAKKVCSNCGSENTIDARFCANCGAEQRSDKFPSAPYQPQHTKQSKRKKRRFNAQSHARPRSVALWVIGGCALFVGGLYFFGERSKPPRPVLSAEVRSLDPAIEAKVMEVASKFICSCGTCGELPLETCGCGTAVQERQFIRSSLEAGQSVDKVIAAVNTSFGWMKPQFAAKYDSTSRKGIETKRLTIPVQKELGLTFLQSKSLARTATIADRVEIFSRFQCPCGQCGIDELKDCNCNHPRGAIEVKAFADQKIAENKYSVAQVIEQVEKKYGRRKF